MSIEDILIRDFVKQYTKVWDGMNAAKTEEEFAEAKRYLFGWYDGTRSLDPDVREAVFAQVKK
jgi:hypothetical protein